MCMCVCVYALQCMHACMHGWMDGWMDGCMDGWMDGWMNGWMDGWMDGWIYVCMYVCMCIYGMYSSSRDDTKRLQICQRRPPNHENLAVQAPTQPGTFPRAPPRFPRSAQEFKVHTTLSQEHEAAPQNNCDGSTMLGGVNTVCTQNMQHDFPGADMDGTVAFAAHVS